MKRDLKERVTMRLSEAIRLGAMLRPQARRMAMAAPAVVEPKRFRA